MLALFGAAYPIANGSDCGTGYGWKSSPSISGAVLWVAVAKALNQAPSAVRNFTGEAEELLAAFGMSLPRGDRPTPQTKFALLSAWSAS